MEDTANNMDPANAEMRRKAQRELDEEDEDPNFFSDIMDSDPRFKTVGSSSKQMDPFARQKRIDDANTQIIMTALETGVRLNDPIYEEMLEQYPHYQVKLERREKRITKMKTFINKIENPSEYEAENKYKFQEQIKGKRNLQSLNSS